jgi:hypothetical protein
MSSELYVVQAVKSGQTDRSWDFAPRDNAKGSSVELPSVDDEAIAANNYAVPAGFWIRDANANMW